MQPLHSCMSQGSSTFLQRDDQNVNILYENGKYTAPNQDTMGVTALKQSHLHYLAH